MSLCNCPADVNIQPGILVPLPSGGIRCEENPLYHPFDDIISICWNDDCKTQFNPSMSSYKRKEHCPKHGCEDKFKHEFICSSCEKNG